MTSQNSFEDFVIAALVPEGDHRSGNAEHAEKLLSKNPEYATASFAGAVVTGNADRVRDLIKQDATLATQTMAPKGWSPILYSLFSIFYRDRKESRQLFHAIVEELLKAGADANSCFMLGDEKETCIYAAAGVANDPEMTKLLLEAGADPNVLSSGQSPLHSTLLHVRHHDEDLCDEVLRLLLDAGASVQTRDDDNEPVLAYYYDGFPRYTVL